MKVTIKSQLANTKQDFAQLEIGIFTGLYSSMFKGMFYPHIAAISIIDL